MRSMANSIFIFPRNEHTLHAQYIYKRILRIFKRLKSVRRMERFQACRYRF